MNRFGLQIKELREKADELRNVHVDDESVGLLFAAIGAMREAAYTIEKLEPHSNQLEPSRYFELFGTPERAARTLKAIPCGSRPCSDCPVSEPCFEEKTNPKATLEWLRGKEE